MKYIGELKVKILNRRHADGPKPGEVLSARKLDNLFNIATGYQVIDGPHIGKRFSWEDCVEIVEGLNNKVKLPKHVADAVQLCQDHELSGFGIVRLVGVTRQLFRDYPREVIEALETIKSFTYLNANEGAEGDTGADIIMKALVNGYEVDGDEA